MKKLVAALIMGALSTFAFAGNGGLPPVVEGKIMRDADALGDFRFDPGTKIQCHNTLNQSILKAWECQLPEATLTLTYKSGKVEVHTFKPYPVYVRQSFPGRGDYWLWYTFEGAYQPEAVEGETPTPATKTVYVLTFQKSRPGYTTGFISYQDWGTEYQLRGAPVVDAE